VNWACASEQKVKKASVKTIEMKRLIEAPEIQNVAITTKTIICSLEDEIIAID
jgi:hypothetical protein